MAQDPPRTVLLLRQGVKYVFLAVFPIVLIIVALRAEILERWLGVTFSQNGTEVLRLIADGVFVNSLAQLPFALIQSAGRPDITAKVVKEKVKRIIRHALMVLNKKKWN